MISFSIYKIVHLTGILMVFLSLGGLTLHAINGGGRVHAWRKPSALAHGIGLLLALIGGFGMLARLGLAHNGLPGWIIAKIAIWLILGGMTAVLVRKQSWAKPIWATILFLGILAAYLAGYKPF